MAPLSTGRSLVASANMSCSTNAIITALRYVCMRRQFQDPKKK